MRCLALAFTLACLTAQAQTPSIADIYNLGTGKSTPLAPGAQVNIIGANLGDPNTVSCGTGGANPVPVPTVCGGVSVTVNGKPVLVKSEQSQSVNIYVPIDLTGTTATVQLTRQAAGQTLQSNSFAATVAPVAPGLFTSTAPGGGTVNNFTDSAGNLVTVANPAKPGDTIRALGTGFGVTNPPLAPGTVVPGSPAYNIVAPVKVSVGGQNATVVSATLFAGGLGAVDQVSFQVPSGLTGPTVAVSLTVGAATISAPFPMPVAIVGPNVTTVVNSASNAVTGLPNAGVAPGSILVAYGSSLGPATLITAPGYPWPATLSGTSAQVTVGGKTVNLLLYYTSANQIAGLLPSTTPTGTGTITVTYNNQTGGSSPITVLANNFGVYTVPQNGSGPAIVTFADYTLVSQTKDASCGPAQTNCGAANPGETLIIWGTGLGAVTGDEAGGPLPGDMPNLPVQVFVGGASATVVYRGRSGCCVGEDQIAFVVPANITGCNVPLVIQINKQVSNYSTIAVAPSGRTCVPSYTQVPTSATTAANPRVGSVQVSRSIFPAPQFPNDPTSSDDANVFTFKLGESAAQLNTVKEISSLGACLVIPGDIHGIDPPIAALLDSGPSFTLTGPGGTRTIAKTNLTGQYSAHLGNASKGNFLDPGSYTLTGTAGADVGAISSTFQIANFTTSQPASGSANISRATVGTVTWSGADPAGVVTISGNVSGQFGLNLSFVCPASASANSFALPQTLLLALPAGPGSLTVAYRPPPTPIAATGLDYAGIFQTWSNTTYVTFQ